jgi:ferredoxin-NADP reductase
LSVASRPVRWCSTTSSPAAHLYLFGTGTGLAPFLSLIRDPEAYERFDKVILFHGVRHVNELAYQDYIERELPNDEFLGEYVRDKLLYYPSVTREPYRNKGRLTDLILSNKMTDDLGLPPLNPDTDRAMICGSPSMNKDTADAARRARLRRIAGCRRTGRLRDRTGLRRALISHAGRPARPETAAARRPANSPRAWPDIRRASGAASP